MSTVKAAGDTLAGAVSQATFDNVSPTNDAKQTRKATRLGRFEIRELLGAGAFGRVYKAYDPQLERFVALKLPIFAATDQQRVRRFIAEAKHAARLSHPNIVQVFETGQVGDKSFIATQFVEGETLAARISRQQLAARESAELVVQLADALAYAHQHGIIHRDIKPDNIMLDDCARPLIMDFGLAKRLDDNANMTRDGALLGTPAYMSPEQARGEIEHLGPASDQYSLGVVLYRLLAGTTPFAGPMHAVIANVAVSQAPSLSQCGRFVPWELAAICDKTLKYSALDRYPDCNALKTDLSRWLMGQPISIKPAGRRQSVPLSAKWLRNRPIQIALGSLGFMLLASIIILFKGNRIEIADGANAHIKIDGDNLIVESSDPATVDESIPTPSTDAPTPSTETLAPSTVLSVPSTETSDNTPLANNLDPSRSGANSNDAPTPSTEVSTPLNAVSDNLLPPVTTPKKWHFYRDLSGLGEAPNAKASIIYDENAVSVDVQQVAGDVHFTQLFTPAIKLEDGERYRFTVRARSPDQSRIRCCAGLAQPDYHTTGLLRTIRLLDEFQTFQFDFVAVRVDKQNCRIVLDLNIDVGKIYISNVTLQKYAEP